MARIVEVDHRPGELRDLRRDLVERRTCRHGAENLGMAARVVNVVEPGQGPVAGPGRPPGEIRNVEERDRRLASQRCECSIAQVLVEVPEVGRTEIDIAERYHGGRYAVLAAGDSGWMHCRRHN